MNSKLLVGSLLALAIIILVFTQSDDYGEGEMPEVSEFHDYDSVAEQKIYAKTHLKEGYERKAPEQMYYYIEDIPKDFVEVRIKFQYPSFKKEMDVCKMPVKYYNQPEWFPNFESKGIETINNAKPNRIGISTVPQIYPSDQIVSLPAGNSFTLCTWLRGSYLSELYVGMKPIVKYPNKIEIAPDQHGIDGMKIDNIKADFAEKYIHVSVSPDEFYLRPSFPVFGGLIYNNNIKCKIIGCDENIWTKRLEIKIKVDKECPSGYYAIGLDFGKPTPETREKYYDTFGLDYKSTGGMMRLVMDRPAYQCLVKVL